MHGLVRRLRLAVGIFTAIWAYHFFVLISHLLEKSGKSLATVLAQSIDRFIAGSWSRHYFTSPFCFAQLVEPSLKEGT
jgi:hypothetical protein